MGDPARRMDHGEAILAVKCTERNREITRHVRLCELSFEKLRFLYERLSSFEVLFNDHIKGDFKKFVSSFVLDSPSGPVPTGLIWEIDDVGIAYLTEIRPGLDALAHFAFWDKRFSGRHTLLRELIRHCMETYHLHRIRAEVPFYAAPAIGAAKRIGFTQEGRARKAVRWKNEWWDVALFGILQEDLDGRQD